jgi:hypothetical protein
LSANAAVKLKRDSAAAAPFPSRAKRSGGEGSGVGASGSGLDRQQRFASSPGPTRRIASLARFTLRCTSHPLWRMLARDTGPM